MRLIRSWGSGANPWGPEREDQFSKPNHYDGMLEIVGVSGVVHMGQIQSGLRSASRIAQGGHVSNEFLESLAHRSCNATGELNYRTPIELIFNVRKRRDVDDNFKHHLHCPTTKTKAKNSFTSRSITQSASSTRLRFCKALLTLSVCDCDCIAVF